MDRRIRGTGLPGRDAGKRCIGRIHRALRRNPRVASLRSAVRDRNRHGRIAASILDRAAGCRSHTDRPRLWADHPRFVAGPGPDHAPATNGADLFDQADGRPCRRRAGRRGASRRRARDGMADGAGAGGSGGTGRDCRRRIHAQAARHRSRARQGVFAAGHHRAPEARGQIASAGRTGAAELRLRGRPGLSDEFPRGLPSQRAGMVAGRMWVSAYSRYCWRCRWSYSSGGRSPTTSWHRAGR